MRAKNKFSTLLDYQIPIINFLTKELASGGEPSITNYALTTNVSGSGTVNPSGVNYT